MFHPNKLSQKNAFSFLEFLVVVGIIGILAAIAIPAYGDYVTKSKANKMLRDSRQLKVAIADYRAIQNKFVSISKPEDFKEIYKIENPTETSDVIDKVEVKAMGPNKVVISVLATGASLSLKEGQSLELLQTGIWTKDDGIKWTCTAKGQVKFAPAACKEKK